MFLQIDRKITLEARQHGINKDVLNELMKEYRKVRRKKPRNFAELIEGAVC